MTKKNRRQRFVEQAIEACTRRLVNAGLSPEVAGILARGESLAEHNAKCHAEAVARRDAQYRPHNPGYRHRVDPNGISNR